MEEYFFIDQNNERRGPIAMDKLISLGMNSQTMVWKKGMANWQAAGAVPELNSLLTQASEPEQTTPPSVPKPVSAPNVGPIKPQPPFRKPDNVLVWAILTTIFCCLPFGIAAIVYANKVDTLWLSGDYHRAKDAAKTAATFCWVGLGCWIFFGIISIIIIAVAESNGAFY